VHWAGQSRRGSYAVMLLMVAAATLAGLVLPGRVGSAGADLLYLLPVLAASILYGLRQGMAASICSALAYNFFFTEPLHSLHISDPGNILTVLILLAVASVSSQLAGRMRTSARAAQESAALNATLVGFARRLIGCAGEQDVGEAICAETGKLFALNTMYLSRTGGALAPSAGESGIPLSSIDMAAAGEAEALGLTTGRGTGRYNAADWTFFPLNAGDRVVALFAIAKDDGTEPIAPGRMPLLESMLDQAALALERVRLEAEMQGVSQLRDRDRLRGALLSSVGHDLRTPLTAILASAAELKRRNGGSGDLADALESEALRLDRLIGNLLDMVRVEAGAIRLNLEPIDLTDAIASAAEDVRHSLAALDFSVAVPPDLPLVTADPQLLHHCLINLLENAARHAPAGSTVTASARECGDWLELAVTDQGSGIPKGMEEMIFERFTRMTGSDRDGGTGLGLAIVKGFADAMGLEVRAAGRGGLPGAELVIRFPDSKLVRLSEVACG
jgi:two-component system sensor histidine kinase KdpD